MKKVLLLGISIIALISALFIGATAAASAAGGSQAWYLNETGGVDGGSLQMLRGNDTTTGSVLIPGDSSKTWIADEAALEDVTFPDGSWITTLTTDTNWAPNSTDKPKISVQIGRYNAVSDTYSYFSTLTAAKIYMKAGKLIIEAEGMLGAETILKDDYLVLTITNLDAASHPVYFADGASNLISPDSDPGYPLPEIAAGILLAGGLIGLVSVIAIRKKKASAAL
jgi:hypothetical protein